MNLLNEFKKELSYKLSRLNDNPESYAPDLATIKQKRIRAYNLTCNLIATAMQREYSLGVIAKDYIAECSDTAIHHGVNVGDYVYTYYKAGKNYAAQRAKVLRQIRNDTRGLI